MPMFRRRSTVNATSRWPLIDNGTCASRECCTETGRLEAFSDAVVAVIITIMVLELKVPSSPDLHVLGAELPTFVADVLSFINVGIYWNNHHHMRAAKRIDGRSRWTNLHLLFWLSLIPLTTAWAGDNHLASVPTTLMMAAVAYTLLQTALVRVQRARRLHYGQNLLVDDGAYPGTL
jgi:uncharacterized membrane protein